MVRKDGGRTQDKAQKRRRKEGMVKKMKAGNRVIALTIAAVLMAGPLTVYAQSSQTQTGSPYDRKTLVVYFSGSGNTKRVAELTADEIGADLFELVPVDPYTEEDQNWRDPDSRVSVEHEDVSLQDVELVSTEVEDWSEYDVVLFGYPLWWREAAWPVNSFVKSNDFTDKTVVTFCTSQSSDLGESGKHLSEMAGTGEWIDGDRFPDTADEETIREWARGLALE